MMPVNFLILALRCELSSLFRNVVAAVVKSVFHPRSARKFCPLEFVGKLLVRCNILHINSLPVATGFSNSVSNIFSVVGKSNEVHGSSSCSVHFIRDEKNLR